MTTESDEPTDAELAERHAQALATTALFVRGVGFQQLTAPTPCEGWDVRDLLNHLVGGNFWVRPLVSGETIDHVGDRLDGDLLGDDILEAYDRSAEEAAGAFLAPGALGQPVAVSYGPVPARVYCGHRLIDVLIHGWDLARATGQDATLPSDLVEVCTRVVAPQAELLAGSGAFGTLVELGDDADPQARLLAVLGRTS
jgi:uncharacterized protein (TIGR03086 family)